ncbi:MAG: Spo0E family sporulation regulatory protein-aspartic acid phosphatase [Thermoactinomyces sp.]
MDRSPFLMEELEKVRKRMQEAADCLGLNHPKVYQLSLELDKLHNMWEKELFTKKDSDRIYPFCSPMSTVKERAKHTMMRAI